MLEALRYKLRTFCIPIDGTAEVLCDNQLVVKNLSIPISNFRKRYYAICNHQVSEAQSDDIIWLGWIEGIKNLADLFMKTTFYITTR